MLKTQRNVIARPLAFGTGVVCLATLLAYVGRWSWACELLVNFRTHFALLLILAIVMAIAIRRWRIAGVVALGITLNVWPMYHVYFGAVAPPVSNARLLRVVEFNVNIANDNLPGIAAYLESLAPDVAVMAELSPANADSLADLMPRFPHRYLAEKEGVWGVATNLNGHVAVRIRWLLASGRAPEAVTLLDDFKIRDAAAGAISITGLQHSILLAKIQLALRQPTAVIGTLERLRATISATRARDYLNVSLADADRLEGQAHLQLLQPELARPLLERAHRAASGLYAAETSLTLADSKLALAECLRMLKLPVQSRELLRQAGAIYSRHPLGARVSKRAT